MILPRNPGAGYEYSNVGVGVLGHALALKTGRSYEILLRERILSPLGLNDTFISLPAEKAERRASGYSGVVWRPPFQMASLESAGALLSTARDLLAFLEFNAGLQSSPLAPAFADAAKVRRATDLPGISIGLGWWVMTSGANTFVVHGGNTMGQSAFIAYQKPGKTAVVVLSNARFGSYSDIQDIGLNLLGYPIPLAAIRRPPSVPLELLRKYQGIYTGIDETVFDIRLTNKFLTFSYTNPSTNLFTTLYPESQRLFKVYEPGVNASGTFNTNAIGQVISMLWNQSGQSLAFQRMTTPAQIQLHVSGGESHLNLSGDSQLDYVIERSEDLQQWLPISTNSIWNNPIQLPAPGRPHQFFRAKAR